MAAKKAEAAAAAAAVPRSCRGGGGGAKRWADFEANKDSLWASASSEAKQQRAEAALDAGLDAAQLSGAASWVKLDDGHRPSASNPTRDEYLQQALDAHGYKFVPDGPSEEERQEEAAAWRRGGGDAADETAGREKWAACGDSDRRGKVDRAYG